MPNVVIGYWSAVELFCHVIAKYEPNTALDSFQNTDFIWTKLRRYSKPAFAELISKDVFGETVYYKNERTNDGTVAKVEKRKITHPSIFYQLSRCIRFKHTITLSEEILNKIMAYVDNAGSNPVEINYQQAEEQKFDERHQVFQNKVFQLYFFDQYKDEKSGKTVTGISRGVLKLKPFGKAQIISIKPGSLSHEENYEGIYEIYNKRYLALKMVLMPNKEKDLEVRADIGKVGFPTFIIALYRNFSRTAYSGTLILENDKDKELSTGFFELDTEGYKDLPEHIKMYCQGKRRNMLRIPPDINNVYDFKKWHERKNFLGEDK